jgi:hypothetical protein
MSMLIGQSSEDMEVTMHISRARRDASRPFFVQTTVLIAGVA